MISSRINRCGMRLTSGWLLNDKVIASSAFWVGRSFNVSFLGMKLRGLDTACAMLGDLREAGIESYIARFKKRGIWCFGTSYLNVFKWMKEVV